MPGYFYDADPAGGPDQPDQPEGLNPEGGHELMPVLDGLFSIEREPQPAVVTDINEEYEEDEDEATGWLNWYSPQGIKSFVLESVVRMSYAQNIDELDLMVKKCKGKLAGKCARDGFISTFQEAVMSMLIIISAHDRKSELTISPDIRPEPLLPQVLNHSDELFHGKTDLAQQEEITFDMVPSILLGERAGGVPMSDAAASLLSQKYWPAMEGDLTRLIGMEATYHWTEVTGRGGNKKKIDKSAIMPALAMPEDLTPQEEEGIRIARMDAANLVILMKLSSQSHVAARELVADEVRDFKENLFDIDRVRDIFAQLRDYRRQNQEYIELVVESLQEIYRDDDQAVILVNHTLDLLYGIVGLPHLPTRGIWGRGLDILNLGGTHRGVGDIQLRKQISPMLLLLGKFAEGLTNPQALRETTQIYNGFLIKLKAHVVNDKDLSIQLNRKRPLVFVYEHPTVVTAQTGSAQLPERDTTLADLFSRTLKKLGNPLGQDNFPSMKIGEVEGLLFRVLANETDSFQRTHIKSLLPFCPLPIELVDGQIEISNGIVQIDIPEVMTRYQGLDSAVVMKTNEDYWKLHFMDIVSLHINEQIIAPVGNGIANSNADFDEWKWALRLHQQELKYFLELNQQVDIKRLQVELNANAGKVFYREKKKNGLVISNHSIEVSPKIVYAPMVILVPAENPLQNGRIIFEARIISVPCVDVISMNSGGRPGTVVEDPYSRGWGFVHAYADIEKSGIYTRHLIPLAMTGNEFKGIFPSGIWEKKV